MNVLRTGHRAPERRPAGLDPHELPRGAGADPRARLRPRPRPGRARGELPPDRGPGGRPAALDTTFFLRNSTKIQRNFTQFQ